MPDLRGLTLVALVLATPASAGQTLDGATIQAAIAATTTGDVALPAGTYVIDTAKGGITLPSHTTLRGAGRGRTVIVCDDTAGARIPCLSSAPGPTYGIHLRDLTLRGKADVLQTAGPAHLAIIQNCTDCSAENVESLHSRVFGLLFDHCDGVVVRGNRIQGSISDGIAVWSTANAIIAENEIIGASDDAISAHSADSDPAPVRSGLVIANNTITESQGIDVLGAKTVQITGNVLRRIMTYGIRVEAEPGGNQGNTAVVAVTIANNIVTDVFQRAEPNPPNGAFAYLVLGGGPPAPQAGAPPSGLLGSGSGALYANPGQGPAPGGWFIVQGNTLLRTLPATTAWSQWGYGAALWVGKSPGNPHGLYRGGIPAAALAYDGIHITGPLPHSRIAGNLIRTTGAHAIAFDVPSLHDLDFDGLAIADNDLSGFTASGIAVHTASPSRQRITIRGNLFDGGVEQAPLGIDFGPTVNAALIQDNQFRNLITPLAGMPQPPGLVAGNILYGTVPPAAAPASGFTIIDAP